MPEIFVGEQDVPPEETDGIALVGPEAKARNVKEQRDSLNIVFSLDPTYLVIVAVHKEAYRNNVRKIPCNKAVPIGGYVYDVVTDSYAVACADYMVLGYLPMSMILHINSVGHYSIRIPMCDSVVRRMLSPSQKKDVRGFRNAYKPEDHDLHFVQMIDSNG